MMQTESPGCTRATSCTAPNAVTTPQPTSAAFHSGMPAGSGTADAAGTTQDSAKHDTKLKCRSRSPSTVLQSRRAVLTSCPSTRRAGRLAQVPPPGEALAARPASGEGRDLDEQGGRRTAPPLQLRAAVLRRDLWCRRTAPAACRCGRLRSASQLGVVTAFGAVQEVAREGQNKTSSGAAGVGLHGHLGCDGDRQRDTDHHQWTAVRTSWSARGASAPLRPVNATTHDVVGAGARISQGGGVDHADRRSIRHEFPPAPRRWGQAVVVGLSSSGRRLHAPRPRPPLGEKFCRAPTMGRAPPGSGGSRSSRRRTGGARGGGLRCDGFSARSRRGVADQSPRRRGRSDNSDCERSSRAPGLSRGAGPEENIKFHDRVKVHLGTVTLSQKGYRSRTDARVPWCRSRAAPPGARPPGRPPPSSVATTSRASSRRAQAPGHDGAWLIRLVDSSVRVDTSSHQVRQEPRLRRGSAIAHRDPAWARSTAPSRAVPDHALSRSLTARSQAADPRRGPQATGEPRSSRRK